MGVSKTNGRIKIMINKSNSSQKPPASSKAPNEDLKYMDVLSNIKIKIESQNLDQRPVTVSISRPRFQTSARNLQPHIKPQMRT